MHWQTTRFLIDLSTPKVMGIVNVTPDSFSDGGRYASCDAAVAHCAQLVHDGADILDIGGESTRPGAVALSLQEELDRVMPVLEYALGLGVPVSVDSYKPALMQAALEAGADVINDVWAMRWRDPADGLAAGNVIAAHGRCGVCLMHMHRDPQTMQVQPMEGDVLPHVLQFLKQQAQYLQGLGVHSDRISLDPGIGFGKTVPQNFALLARQRELLSLGYPVLAGWSRKSSLAAVIGSEAGSGGGQGSHERMVASVSAALIAVQQGAGIVRVHDVKPTVQALAVLAAVQAQAKPQEPALTGANNTQRVLP